MDENRNPAAQPQGEEEQEAPPRQDGEQRPAEPRTNEQEGRGWPRWATYLAFGVVAAIIIMFAVSRMRGGQEKSPPPIAKAQVQVDFSVFIGAVNPLRVEFTAQVPTEDVVKYIWNFGDGLSDSTSGVTASHMYKGPATYPVKLSVTTADGGHGSAQKDVVVTTQQQQQPAQPETNLADDDAFRKTTQSAREGQ